jgi:hypothetical protein
MIERSVILRETIVSVLINTALSIVFFLVVFGIKAPIRLGDMALDFLPQTFMVALMGTLIPPLILRRKAGAAVRPIVVRSFIAAVVSLALAGGAAYVVCRGNADFTFRPAIALLMRAIYGAILALIVTPWAIKTLTGKSRQQEA